MLISKITDGYVQQLFDSETKQLVSQKFVASDECYVEDTDVLCEHVYIDLYHPYDMVQPEGTK